MPDPPERRRGRLDFEARAAPHAHDFAPHRWQYCLNATLQLVSLYPIIVSASAGQSRPKSPALMSHRDDLEDQPLNGRPDAPVELLVEAVEILEQVDRAGVGSHSQAAEPRDARLPL